MVGSFGFNNLIFQRRFVRLQMICCVVCLQYTAIHDDQIFIWQQRTHTCLFLIFLQQNSIMRSMHGLKLPLFLLLILLRFLKYYWYRTFFSSIKSNNLISPVCGLLRISIIHRSASWSTIFIIGTLMNV